MRNKTCTSFFSKTFVRNTFHSDKYLSSYAGAQTKIHVKWQLLLSYF